MLAIAKGNLKYIPNEFLTDNNLTKVKDYNYDTGLHFIARHKQLNLISPNLLTQENFTQKNRFIETPLSICIVNKNFKQIPYEVFKNNKREILQLNNINKDVYNIQLKKLETKFKQTIKHKLLKKE
jgi:hypothetical protein